jgi:hypothetical protein
MSHWQRWVKASKKSQALGWTCHQPVRSCCGLNHTKFIVETTSTQVNGVLVFHWKTCWDDGFYSLLFPLLKSVYGTDALQVAERACCSCGTMIPLRTWSFKISSYFFSIFPKQQERDEFLVKKDLMLPPNCLEREREEHIIKTKPSNIF